MYTRNIKTILLGGFIAGTLDIGAASLISGANPIAVLQFIARGLIGKEAAVSGGTTSATLGILLQWAMSIFIAAIYVFATARMPVLRRKWIATGLAYGVVVFVVMNYVVMPLSRVNLMPHFGPTSFALNMAAMLLFGLIIAWCARDASTKSA